MAATVHILLTHNKKNKKKRGTMINRISVAPTKWRQECVGLKPYDSGNTRNKGP